MAEHTAVGIILLIVVFGGNIALYFNGIRDNLWYGLMWVVTSIIVAVISHDLMGATKDVTDTLFLVYTGIMLFVFVIPHMFS